MRRIVATLVALIALACLAPKAFGFLVAGHHERFARSLADRVRGGELVAQETDSGWLITRTRHRLILTDPSAAVLIADLTGRPDFAAPPALVIDSGIAHGPWPLFEGSPGLARMHSIVSLDIDGELIPIPGEAVTDIAFDGSGVSHLTFRRLDTTVQGGASIVVWEGARLRLAFARDFDRLDSEGSVGALTMLGPQGELRLGEARIDGRSHATPYGFWAGSSRLTVDAMSVTGVDGQVIRADSLELDLNVALDGETVGHRVDLTVDGLRADPLDDATIRLSAETVGLSAPAIGRLTRAADGRPINFAPAMIPGAAVRIDEFSVRAGNGELSFSGHCMLPEEADVPVDSLDLTTSLTGEGRLRISGGLLDRGQGSQTEALVATGYLKLAEDGSLSADFRVGSGLLTVNGLPMPLIIPR